MTIYARSDLAYVHVSQSHGGCGEPHRRPVEQGAPAKLWALTCNNGCENHLRGSDLWSSTVAEIPETHDEQSDREDYEKRGANDIQTMMALALTRMTGGEVPDTVARMIDGSKLHLPSQVKVLCPPHGHANPPGGKFCGECGSSMRDAVPAEEAPSRRHLEYPVGREAPTPGRAPTADLASLHPQKLRKMCRAKGLDDTGRVVDMVARLQREAEGAAA